MRDPGDRSEIDIAAFVNERLEPDERFLMAEYLASHPDRAADVMADLRLTEGLKLALTQIESPPPPQLLAAADRLARGLGPRRRLWRLLPFAAAVALIAFPGIGQSVLARLKTASHAEAALIEAALDAQDAMELRLAMASQPETPLLDAHEISSAMGILIPDLPADWQVRDVQVVSTPERPGVAIAIDTAEMGEIMLFSVTRSTDGPDNPPNGIARDGKSLAFFEKGTTAYVLVDNSGPLTTLTKGAATLRSRFN